MQNFLTGARTLGTGFRVLLRSPKLLVIGAIPALISAVLLVGALGSLVYFSGDLVGWMTPFADGWAEGLRRAVRVLLGVVLVGAAALLASITFIALTLLIGGPFYEYIAERTEQRLGLDDRADGAGFARQLGRGIRDSVKLVAVAALGAVVLFGFGFVPVLGQTVIPVLGAMFGAWMVALEMVGLVFQRRGRTLRDRHRSLWANKAATLGFGLPAYLLCLIPVLQLVVIPSAVVGGTLLAHRFEDGVETV
ncbi:MULTISPECIES: EI24 domain-containing protein [unclassified Saccharopolyspora]|uniref:EI24 domain-containing protein n=1 Tax=Saccharopolyspora TaxID=1835 RepID=UPI00190BABCE|nr:EI24 domain-containing protein [Saccharopolyspora sp. HNM0986]MBK0869177.1 EI24 domain-containing protein [Saccharopolyspora sp. HNM0986]